MEVYDGLGQEWKPFIMYSGRPNFRSNVVNLDQFGLRYNYSDKKKLFENEKENSIFDIKLFSKDKETAALIGGSSAFGVGATTDSSTVSSLLSAKTNMHFFNLGGRAFSGFQEIILFQSLINRLTNIKKIIIFSGLNDIFLTNYILRYDPILGPYYFNNQFIDGMFKSTANWKRNLAKFFIDPFIKDNIDWNLITKKELLSYFFKNFNFSNNDETLNNLLKRNFKCWSNIQKAMDVKIIYVLQPMANWCSKNFTEEENKIFKELDMSSYKAFKTLRLLNLIKYKNYKNNIIENCKHSNIEFIDCNDYISNKHSDKKEWLFVDRVHLTDLGYKYISELIASKL